MGMSYYKIPESLYIEMNVPVVNVQCWSREGAQDSCFVRNMQELN